MKNRKLNPQVSLLIADDDADDRMLVQEAFSETNLAGHINFVKDGEELLNYLFKEGDYKNEKAPLPGLILLDVNMPFKSGLEALEEIKTHAKLRAIPVVMLSTSNRQGDIQASYNLGAASFIVKPKTYEGYLKIAERINEYWFDTTELPVLN